MPDELAPPAPALRWTVVVVAVALVAFTWPLLSRPLHIVGHPLGEADNHFWMFWRALRQLGQDGALANFPVGLPLPLMDPVNLPLAVPGGLLHPVLGYHGVLLGNLLLGMGAAGWLARQFVSTRAAWVAMVAVGCSPFMGGAVDFGITESWTLWPLAAHLGFTWRYAQRGGAREAVGAGLCLGAFALSGWYHAFFGVIVQLVLLPWLVWRFRRWKGLVGQGLLAGFLVLPSLLLFLSMRDFWAGRWHLPMAAPRAHLEHWRWLRNYGTDALNLVLPSLEPAPISLSVYLGLGILVLAALGCWRFRRLALPFGLLACIFVLLAMGHWLRIGGDVLRLAGHPVSMPARWLVQLFPPLSGLSHWHRAVGPATVFLGLLASLGVESLLQARWRADRGAGRLTALALVAAGLLLLESLILGQTAWPRSSYDPGPPAVYAALQASGALVELPFDNGRPPFSQLPARIYNRWQPFHGRPVSESYEGPDALLASSRLIAVLDHRCGVAPARPPHERAPVDMQDPAPLEDPAVLAAAVDDLVDSGVAYILLHRERAVTPARAEALLVETFGPPEVDRDGRAAWRVIPRR